MIKELTCLGFFFFSRTSDPSPHFFIFLLICSKIRAEPCKLLHVHWEIADPVFSRVSRHGNASGCSVSCGWGTLPQQLWCKSHALLSWSLNCQNKACLGSRKLVLGSPHGRTHPSSLTLGVRSTGPRAWPECCGSQLQMGLCSLLHSVCSFSLSSWEREQYSWFFCLVSQPYICTGFLPWLVRLHRK